MSDLRTLLQACRPVIAEAIVKVPFAGIWVELLKSIDAALAESAPEPVDVIGLARQAGFEWDQGDSSVGMQDTFIGGYENMQRLIALVAQPSASPSDARTAMRLNWIVDWACRGGDRNELDEYGHIRVTTREIVLQHIDAAIEREGGAP